MMSNAPTSNLLQTTKHRYRCMFNAVCLQQHHNDSSCTNCLSLCVHKKTAQTQTHTNTVQAASTYRPAVRADPVTSFSSSSSSSSSMQLAFYHFAGVSRCFGFNTPLVLLPSHWTSHLHSFQYFLKSRVSADNKGIRCVRSLLPKR